MLQNSSILLNKFISSNACLEVTPEVMSHVYQQRRHTYINYDVNRLLNVRLPIIEKFQKFQNIMEINDNIENHCKINGILKLVENDINFMITFAFNYKGRIDKCLAKMNKKKSSNEILSKNTQAKCFLASVHSNLSCRTEASRQQLARSKLEQGNEKHQDVQNTFIQNTYITCTLLQPLLEFKYP